MGSWGQRTGARGHLLIPAFLLLASVALAISGGISHPPAAVPADGIVNASVQREVAELRELADDGSCALIHALSRADRLSATILNVMLQLSETLDRVSRDASVLVHWVENLVTQDGLDGFEDLLDDAAHWLEGSFESPHCSGEHDPGSDTEPPCRT
jgi:hypothetical protein